MSRRTRALVITTCLSMLLFVSFVHFTAFDSRFGESVLQIWPNSADVGYWGPIIPAGLVPVAAASLPHSGRVVLWAAERPDVFSAGDEPDNTVTALYDPQSTKISSTTLANTHHDMFCPGLSMDTRGRPFVTGGLSSSRTSIYSEEDSSWINGANMTLGRGYHSQVTLSNGRIFTIGGSWSGGIGGDGVPLKNGEIWHPRTDSWSLLEGCSVESILTRGNRGMFESDNHAWLFAWRNNSVFQAGPSSAMNWFDTHGSGSQLPAGLRGNDRDSMNGNAVMYDASRGKILTLGGATSYADAPATASAHIITISEPYAPPQVERIASMKQARAYANSLVLPSGEVFINGGVTWAKQWKEENTTWQPELWTPQINSFKTVATSPISRVYHSVAILLPDATVLTAGGGMCWAKCEDPSVNHQDVQIFSPPYLFEPRGSRLARRPTIIHVTNRRVHPGASVRVTTDVHVSAFSLLRYAAATHSINTDQRRVPLSFKLIDNPQHMYEFAIPDDAGIVVPGYWMLFAIDAAGVPSVAETIRINTEDRGP